MDSLGNWADEVDYEQTNRNILDGNVNNTPLIIYKWNYGAIDADDNSCHGYYIIIFSSSLYTSQEYLNMYWHVIYSGEMVCKGTYYYQITINYNCCISWSNKKNTTTVYFSKIIIRLSNEKWCDSNDVVMSSLRKNSQNIFSSITPLHVSTE